MENKLVDLESTGNRKVLISEEQNGMLIWLGSNENVSKAAGQIFYNTTNARLDSVAVLPHAASNGSRLLFEMYKFDAFKNEWLEKLHESTEEINHTNCEKWLSFKMGKTQLESGSWYGFKLSCTAGEVALAEGLHPSSKARSMEWTAIKSTDKGVFHNDFHLAYMVELAA